MDPVYLTEKEVSAITKQALSTLRNDRHHRRGFPYVKLGKSIRYNLADVIERMESNKVNFDMR
jgi:hypothetical protein